MSSFRRGGRKVSQKKPTGKPSFRKKDRHAPPKQNLVLNEYQNFENDEEIESDEASGDELENEEEKEEETPVVNENFKDFEDEVKGLSWTQDSDEEDENNQENQDEDIIPKIPKLQTLYSKTKTSKTPKVEEEEEDLDLDLGDDEEDEEEEEENEEDEKNSQVHQKMLQDVRSTLKGKKKSGRTVEVEDEFQEESQYNLPPIKRKRPEKPQQDNKKQKQDQSLAKKDEPDTGLSLETLMSSVSRKHSNLKKQLSSLAKSKTETVAVPEEKVRVERALRKQAYTESSKQVSDWEPALKAQETAQHRTFPLAENEPAIRPPTTDGLVVTFRAKNEMEKQIENLLRGAKLQQSKDEFDGLAPSATNPRLIAEQRAELIRMRNLVAYQQLKISRQNKIKSKTYRKIKKRERESKDVENIENDPALQEEEEEKGERTRILERMTLRHKNKTRQAKAALRASHRF